MARYTVHVKGEGPDALARAQFVRDGFSWAAFAFGPFWLFAKGAWISALLLVALFIGIGIALGGLGIAAVFPLISCWFPISWRWNPAQSAPGSWG